MAANPSPSPPMAANPAPSATRAAREVAFDTYASLDLCPWCNKGLGKVIPAFVMTAFCPSCKRDVLAWSQGRQEELESQQKGVRVSNAMEKKSKDAELLRKIKEAGMVDKTMPKKANVRE